MVWQALRCDDLQSIDPATVSFSQLGLKFLLHRTKTSGPGNKHGALQGFVLRGVSLTGYDWLAAGTRFFSWTILNSHAISCVFIWMSNGRWPLVRILNQRVLLHLSGQFFDLYMCLT